MTSTRWKRLASLVFVAVLGMALALLAGCGQKAAKSGSPVATPPKSGTALGSLAAAQSAVSATMAPDAKLLFVQTVDGVEPTGTPVWAFFFGSPSSDKTFVVYMANGDSIGKQEYGAARLSKTQWAAVPGLEAWKIDSDVAYVKALAAAGGKGDPTAYMMGFTTYRPEGSTSTVDPFVWSVRFNPGTSGVTTTPVNVNTETGAASVAKD